MVSISLIPQEDGSRPRMIIGAAEKEVGRNVLKQDDRVLKNNLQLS